jgi:hypothetical protein
LLRLRLLLRRRVELTRRLGCRLLLRLGLRLKLLRAGIGTLLVRRPEPTMAVITTAVKAVARRLLLLGRRRYAQHRRHRLLLRHLRLASASAGCGGGLKRGAAQSAHRWG